MVCKYGTWTRGQDEALLNILGGQEVAEDILSGKKSIVVQNHEPEPELPLLRKVATAQVSANKRFVSDDKAAKRANVGYRSDQFKRLFGDKVEQNVSAATVAVHSLEKESMNSPILAKLGEKAQLPLAYLFELMEKQSNGQQGKLLTNGYANIVYAVGNDGNIWAVGARWHSRCRDWGVCARSVEVPDPWRAGGRILSCDS